MLSVSDQLIKKYCGSLEERITACCDEKVAECLKQNLFCEISRQCKSEVIAEFLNKYVDNLINAKFQIIKN